MTNQESLIRETCDALADFLVAKNRRYADAVGLVSEPLSVFAPECRVDRSLTLRTRLDEKLNRLISSQADDTEDVILDLTGLLILLLAQRKAGGDLSL